MLLSIFCRSNQRILPIDWFLRRIWIVFNLINFDRHADWWPLGIQSALSIKIMNKISLQNCLYLYNCVTWIRSLLILYISIKLMTIIDFIHISE